MSQSCNNTHVNIRNNTIPKNIILNWLYTTDRHVSIEKLGEWLEDNTDGQYKLVKDTRNPSFAGNAIPQR